MNRLHVPNHEDLRERIRNEFATEELQQVALDALNDAAKVRAIKDYVADVEHPMQQQLFVLHNAALQDYEALSVRVEDALHDAGEALISRLDEAQGCCAPAARGCIDTIVEGAIAALFEVALHESDLLRMRELENFSHTVGDLLKSVGLQQSQSAIALDNAILEHMKGLEEKGAPSGVPLDTATSTAVEEKQRNKQRMEASMRIFTVPTAIQRLSYRPYDPDAPFPPNVCLSRPNARSMKPSDVVTDICVVCTNVIADYGKAAQRAHCLECDNGFNASCGPCFRLSMAVVGSLMAALAGATQNTDAPRRALVRAVVRAWEDRSPHLFHHSSGIVEHAMAYLHAHVAQRYANLRHVIGAAFETYSDRPMMGVIVEAHDAERGGGLVQPVGLLHLGNGTYRRWARVTPPRQEDHGVEEDAANTTPKPCRTPEARQRPCTHSVLIPLKDPVEAWRVPSQAIYTASSAYRMDSQLKVPPLKTEWITFGQVFPLVEVVAEQVQALTPMCGDRVVLSVGDSPLWYALEMGIVRGRRCAVGIFHLWEPRDILDAMALSRASVGFVDFHVFRTLCSAVLAPQGEAASGMHRPVLCARLVVLVANDDQRRCAAAQCDALLAFLHGQPSTAFRVLDVADLTAATGGAWFDDLGTGTGASDAVPIAGDGDAVLEEWERNITPAKRLEPTDEKFAAIAVFTSGTSGGKPKGVTTSARQFQLETVDPQRFYGICDSGISAYAPSWATDKHNVWRSVLRGGRANFHCKTRSIFESIGHARVTPALSLVPFLANQLPSMMEGIASEEVDRLTTLLRPTTDASNTETAATTAPAVGGTSTSVHRSIVARSYATAAYHIVEHVLGGRVYILSVGGAAVRPDVLAFLRRVTPCYVMENYGLTECGGVLRDNKPFPGSLVKLVDRPDLGYSTTDVPYPRGEFAVKNMDIATRDEWICDEGARAQIASRYLEDGYFLTGDIGLQRPDGTFEVIDRATAVKKLANGKFFSPERVEQTIMDFVASLPSLSPEARRALFPKDDVAVAMSTFARCVVGCFVCADHTDNATIRALYQLCGAVDNPRASDMLLAIAQTACRLRGIPRDEVPTECYCEVPSYEWTSANGCLTASRKPNRRALLGRLEAACTRSSGVCRGGVSTEGTTPTDAPVVATVEDLALNLLQELVPGHTVATLDAAMSHNSVRTLLPDLGCDSLVLSRIPRLVGPLLQRLRGGLHPSLHPSTIRDATQFPKTFWTTPSLMQQSPLTLAEAAWDASSALLADKEGAATSQPFFTRQGSSVVVEDDAKEAEPCSVFVAGMAMREGSGALEEAPPQPSSVAVADTTTSATSTGATAPLDPIVERIRRIEDLSSEALKASVRQWDDVVVQQRAATARTPGITDKAARVLLTGAAGYYGSNILHGLLEAEWCSSIVCLVRRRGAEAPRDRVWRALTRCVPVPPRRDAQAMPSPQYEALAVLFEAKVNVVDANLEHDLFGLGHEAYECTLLMHRIDLIVHAAAVVKSWSLDAGLDALRPANVDATLRMAQLSCHGARQREDGSAIPMVYVSTISVMKSQDVKVFDNGISWKPLSDFSEASLSYYDAYSATKYMAENLLREWCHLTCSVLRIVRPPLLTWHSKTGAGNEDDWMCRLLDAVLSTRLAPLSNVFVEGTAYAPVDAAAKCLVERGQELLRDEADHLTYEVAFRVVYPHAETARLNIRSVLLVVEEEVAAAVDAATLLTHGSSPQQRDPLLAERCAMGKLLWLPTYAWKCGLDALTLSHPTRYHPLLEKGILELQRAAGVRPINPLGREAIADEKELDTEDLQHIDWVLPLRLYLRNEYFALQP